MPDELPVTDGAPEPTQPDVDFEKRWKDTHAEFNRLNEQFSRFQKDPDAVVEFLRQHHPDLVVDEEEPESEPVEDEYEDPIAQRLAVMEQREQQRQQREQQQELQSEWNGWENYIAEQAKTAGVDLKPRDVKALRLDCVGQNGYPVPPAQAEKALKEYIGEYFAEEPEEKPKPRAPHVVTGGKAGTQVPDFSQMTEREALEWQVERLRGLSAQ